MLFSGNCQDGEATPQPLKRFIRLRIGKVDSGVKRHGERRATSHRRASMFTVPVAKAARTAAAASLVVLSMLGMGSTVSDATAASPTAAPAPATAATPAGAQVPASTVAIAFEFKGCTAEDREAVTRAFGTAQRWVNEAVVRLQAGDAQDNYRTWFGTAETREVVASYQAIADRLASTQPMTVECNAPERCNSGPFAYAYPGQDIVGFCQPFFRARDTGFDSRPGTVVHEMSHLAAGTQDFDYGPTNTRKLAAGSPDRAARNADNYEYFTETMH